MRKHPNVLIEIEEGFIFVWRFPEDEGPNAVVYRLDDITNDNGPVGSIHRQWIHGDYYWGFGYAGEFTTTYDPENINWEFASFARSVDSKIAKYDPCEIARRMYDDHIPF